MLIVFLTKMSLVCHTLYILENYAVDNTNMKVLLEKHGKILFLNYHISSGQSVSMIVPL